MATHQELIAVTWRVQIDDEILHITDLSAVPPGPSMNAVARLGLEAQATVLRGQEGTDAASHSAGATVTVLGAILQEDIEP